MDDPLDLPAAAILTPQAWCRRILTSLTQRKVQSREAGYLEMLLAFFIELNPPAEAFTDLLAQYGSDERPGIAETAAMLQRAWQRARAGEPVAPPLSLQEALRTLGALLDESGERTGYIVVGPDGARLQTFGTASQRKLGPIALRQEIAARTALRGQVPLNDPPPYDRHETRLRGVGAALDEQLPQAYELFVLPWAVVVDGSAGYRHVFTHEELLARLRAAYERRESPAGES